MMRFSSIAFAAIAAAGFLVSAPASAQQAQSGGAVMSPKEVDELADCLAKNRRRPVETFLATFPFSEQSQSAARRVGTPQCLTRDEVFNAEGTRGALYAALYRLDFGKSAAVDLSSALQLDYGPRGDPPVGQPADVLVNLRRYADCVVRQDSANARALVLSGAGSAEESLAFQQLRTAMSGCIVPGQTISFKRPLLKSAISETLYRLTAAAAGRPAPADRK